jgi:hypothetical protein
MLLKLKFLTGKISDIEVGDEDSIVQVKSKIEMFHHPTESQQLDFGGKILTDNLYLKDINGLVCIIKPHSCICHSVYFNKQIIIFN